MKTENVIQVKSFQFAIKVVKVYRQLTGINREFIIPRQLLKCGTSIGANIEEAIGAQSRRDFYAKLTISYKEARESVYWIRLMKETEYLEPAKAKELLQDAEELCRIIGKIQITTKKQL